MIIRKALIVGYFGCIRYSSSVARRIRYNLLLYYPSAVLPVHHHQCHTRLYLSNKNKDNNSSNNTNMSKVPQDGTSFRFFSSHNIPLKPLLLKDEELVAAESWPPRSGDAFDWTVPTNVAYQEADTSSGDDDDDDDHDEDDDNGYSNNSDNQHNPHKFTPLFANARSKLDYSYHKNPERPRQIFQDAILRRVLDAVGKEEESIIAKGNENQATTTTTKMTEPSTSSSTTTTASSSSRRAVGRPWIVFTAGAMGAGKSYVLSQLYQQGLFPLDDFVKIDPDMIKTELPEMAGYQEYIRRATTKTKTTTKMKTKTTAATQVHRESTQLADILFEHALTQGLSILVDGSLRDVDWYRYLLTKLRIEHSPHSYRFMILYVSATEPVIRERAQHRAKSTGREVPEDLLQASMEQVPKSVQALQSLTDITVEISNNDDEPLTLKVLYQQQDKHSNSNNNNNKAGGGGGGGGGEQEQEHEHEHEHEQEQEEGKLDVEDWDWFADLWEPDEEEEEEETSIPKEDEENPTAQPRQSVRQISSVRKSTRPCMVQMVCRMASAFDDAEQHQAARSIWAKAYPRMCPRCAVACDGQCGICIHDKHLCACEICKQPPELYR